jgi:hypothetical protein
VALSVVVAAEIRKAILRRTAAKAIQPASALRAGATTPERPPGARHGQARAGVADGGPRSSAPGRYAPPGFCILPASNVAPAVGPVAGRREPAARCRPACWPCTVSAPAPPRC